MTPPSPPPPSSYATPPGPLPAAAGGKAVLWVDDEADLLESHRIFLSSKGYEVEWATNAEDAVEMLRRRSYDILLLDEQMPGRRGLDAYHDVHELAPNLPVVMVTKSEEDATLREALGANIRDYLVKPINPRQVLTVITRILEGPRIRQQAVARAFVQRFRELELERDAVLDWRGWIARYDELIRWDVELAAAGEASLYDALHALYPHMRREFAQYMRTAYPHWLANLDGNRPPLSIDVVSEFLLPILRRDGAAVLIVIDCLRLDQWRVLEPLFGSAFDVETSHYYSILPTATPYSRNALFSGLFPSEIATRFPDWWRSPDTEDESLNAHERELLELHVRELAGPTPVRYHKISSAYGADELERHLAGSIAREGVTAFVFNFVDLLTHGRSESQILYEVARDEVALRQITRQWFQRSVLQLLLREIARRGMSALVTTDHGSIHCNTPATVFARRDATSNLRYKFGEDLRAERDDQALLFTDESVLRLPKHSRQAHALLATGDCFFVYPTKLREYQSRYRGSFLHGGVSPEEVILPLALLMPH